MKVRAWGAVIAAALAVTVLGGCAAGGTDLGDGGTSLKIGAVLEPTSFDPAQAQEGHYMQYYQAVYDSLILRTPDGDLEPMLATDWSYDETRTALTLHLRDDVTFSDGVKFDAEAAKANLEHFKSAAGPQSHTLDAVSSVKVVDDTTVVVELSAPDPALLIYLSNAAGLMGSPEAIAGDAIKTAPVGSGPYLLDAAKTTSGSQYSFTRKDDYWNPSLQQYDEITISVMPDTTARFNALVSGQVDAASLDARTAEQAESQGLVAHNQGLDWQGLIIFDRAGSIVPALADVRVRQAINLAIDGDAILEEVQLGRGASTGQIFGPNSTAFDESLDDVYGFDPERARTLLDEAGYTDSISIPFVWTSGWDPALLAVMQEQLGDVGISLEVKDVPPNDYITELTSGKYPMAMMLLFQPSSWVTINQAVAPDALFNAMHTSDPAVTELSTVVQTSDDDQAASAAKDLNRHLVEQAWFAPWFRPDALYYSNETVEVETQIEQAAPSIYNYRPAN